MKAVGDQAKALENLYYTTPSVGIIPDPAYLPSSTLSGPSQDMLAFPLPAPKRFNPLTDMPKATGQVDPVAPILVEKGIEYGSYAVGGGLAIREALMLAKAANLARLGQLSNAIRASDAANFRYGAYTERKLTEPLQTVRYFGGKAIPIGQYMTTQSSLTEFKLLDRINLALKPEWNNTMQGIQRLEIPAGTTIYEGQAARQGMWLGGGRQIFIQNRNVLRLQP